jgi:hypothetical protein
MGYCLLSSWVRRAVQDEAHDEANEGHDYEALEDHDAMPVLVSHLYPDVATKNDLLQAVECMWQFWPSHSNSISRDVAHQWVESGLLELLADHIGTTQRWLQHQRSR